MFEFLIIVAAVAALVAVVVYATGLARRAGSELPPRRERLGDAPEPRVVEGAEEVSVTLPIGPVDPEAPTVERLVLQAADQVLHQYPHVKRVVVRDRTGEVLREVLRPDRVKEVAIPEQLSEPQAPRSHTPSPVRPSGVSHPQRVEDVDDLQRPHRSLVERFDLPEDVVDRVSADPSLEELLEAILTAAGHDVTRDGDLLRIGETAVVALHGAGAEAMNHAYRRYDASGALSGLAITVGYLSPREVERRELLAPDLRYVGPDAVQRMADAVALSADPLAFAVGMPLLG